MSRPNDPATAPHGAGYDRRLGTFDATMVVVGAIIGAGIFLNPAIVAQRVGTSALVLAAWALGGVIAVVGALCFAELGARLPRAGGGYVYLRDAFGPLPAFLYGWTQLLVINTGGVAAVAITFASYTADVTGVGEAFVKPLAVGAIVFLSAVNAAGVRFGAWVQNTFTLLKLAALALLVGAGVWLFAHGGVGGAGGPGAGAAPPDGSLVLAMGTALVAVLFAYGGWQHANNIAEEIRDPERRLPLALMVGVGIVVTVYVSANAAYLMALGPERLAASTAPAADALRAAAGGWGGVAISVGVACSTFGILNVFIMAAPRIYQAMAADGIFFASVARLSPRTRTPVVGIWIQMVWAVLLALSGSYGQLLDWVVFGDWIFFGLIVATLFVYRRREAASAAERGGGGVVTAFRAPWHPLLPALFVATAMFVVYSSVVSNPRNALYGTLLIGAGVPAFLGWARKSAKSRA
ncbi:MAG: amino acid permease [Longimicrobiales bacterium]|nr:amino acid permease [Longimicrobiales bacterium]